MVERSVFLEASTVVADFERDAVIVLRQADPNLGCRTMPDGIADCFLRDAIEVGGRSIVGKGDVSMALEGTVDGLASVEGAGEIGEGRLKSFGIDLDGHDSVGEVSHVSIGFGQACGEKGGRLFESFDIGGLELAGAALIGIHRKCALEGFMESVGVEGEAGQFLLDSVMEFESESSLFVGGDFNDMLLHFLSVGDVAEDTGEEAEVIDLADGEIGGKCASIFSAADDFASGADNARFAGGEESLDVSIVFIAKGLWHEHIDILADQFRT